MYIRFAVRWFLSTFLSVNARAANGGTDSVIEPLNNIDNSLVADTSALSASALDQFPGVETMIQKDGTCSDENSVTCGGPEVEPTTEFVTLVVNCLPGKLLFSSFLYKKRKSC